MAQPLDALLTKLAGGHSVVIQVIGDSTAWGAYDDGWDDTTVPWTPPTQRGWPGRFAASLGAQYNATVRVYTWNYPTNTGYFDLVTLYTGSSGATITVYNGGWPGGIMADYLANMSAMLPVPNPDVVMTYDGFNEPGEHVTTGTFASNCTTFIDEVQNTYCPGAPIVVTTQNPTPNYVNLTYYDAMINDFLTGESVPLSPALQESTLVPGVWVLDSQQVPLLSSDIASAPHPNASGYTKIGQWIFGQLASQFIVVPTPAQVALTGYVPEVIYPLYPAAGLIKLLGGVFNTSKLPWTLPFTLTPFPLSGSILPWALPIVLGRLFPLGPAPAKIVLTGYAPVVSGITKFFYPSPAAMAVSGAAVILWQIAFVLPENMVTVRPEGKSSVVVFEPRTVQVPPEDRGILVLGAIPVKGA